jgi:hypothetical protein
MGFDHNKFQVYVLTVYTNGDSTSSLTFSRMLFNKTTLGTRQGDSFITLLINTLKYHIFCASRIRHCSLMFLLYNDFDGQTQSGFQEMDAYATASLPVAYFPDNFLRSDLG